MGVWPMNDTLTYYFLFNVFCNSSVTKKLLWPPILILSVVSGCAWIYEPVTWWWRWSHTGPVKCSNHQHKWSRTGRLYIIHFLHPYPKKKDKSLNLYPLEFLKGRNLCLYQMSYLDLLNISNLQINQYFTVSSLILGTHIFGQLIYNNYGELIFYDLYFRLLFNTNV